MTHVLPSLFLVNSVCWHGLYCLASALSTTNPNTPQRTSDIHVHSVAALWVQRGDPHWVLKGALISGCHGLSPGALGGAK